ncbi:MAG: DUF1634 domain-containing protein [Thermoplasmata archaeon]
MTEGKPPGRSPRPGEEEHVPPALARLISLTLRIGVGLSALLALVGLARLLMGPAAGFTSATVHPAAFVGSAFIAGLAHGQAVDILLLAFLVLILTPLVRVIISAALFASVHDRPFTLLTLTVLLLLGASVLVAVAT